METATEEISRPTQRRRRMQFSLRGLLLAVLLVAISLAGYDAWRRARDYHRLDAPRSAVEGYKQDANVLLARWPTKNGTLPHSGRFVVDPNNVDSILIAGWDIDTTCTHTYGPLVSQASDGGLIFDYFDDKIEYHPNECKPTSFTQTIRGDDRDTGVQIQYHLKNTIELESNWFLVSYTASLVPEAQ
jgi:hypothetical protein